MAGAATEASVFRADALAGRRALVTGGTSGIGREIAAELGRHGAKVAVMGRRPGPIKETCEAFSAEGIANLGLQGDVRKPEDAERVVAATVEAFGGLDLLVNCAAGNFLATPEGLTPNGFRTVMEIDAIGTFTASRAAFPHLKKAGRASHACVLNISATLHYGATWYQVHASAAKAAVDSITRTLGLEWGQYGIRAAGIAPGPIQGTAGMAKLAPGMEEMALQTIPLGTWGQKRDIAMASVFLASNAARFISGETLVVDGANWMWKIPPLPREKVSRASRGVEKHSRSKM